MTTASLTERNVFNLTPIVAVSYHGTGGVNVPSTAADFMLANFRHLINRRLLWSTSEQFVRNALLMLARAVSAPIVRVREDQMAPVIDIVRRATNRRKSYNMVSGELLAAVEAFIIENL